MCDLPTDEHDHRPNLKARELLRTCLERRLTFAAFRVPGEPITIWIQRDPTPARIECTQLDQEERVFVIAPFLSQMGYVHVLRGDIELIAEAEGHIKDPTALETCRGSEPTKLARAIPISRSDYLDSIEAAKQAMGGGSLQKVVLARTLLVPGADVDPIDLFFAAGIAHPGALIAQLNTPLHGTWIGASPERLVVLDEDRFEVDALAGTMRASEAPEEPNAWGEKEREEQQVVTRRIIQRLGALDCSEVNVGPVHVYRAGGIAHLRTRITGRCAAGKRGTLPVTLHPTPAICGEPTVASQEFILAHEVDDRELYAGYWGPWGKTRRCALYVNIRCMRALEQGFAIHVGAGITPGSIAEREWEETELKSRVWLDLIDAQRASR